jgi:hypothetical protein
MPDTMKNYNIYGYCLAITYKFNPDFIQGGHFAKSAVPENENGDRRGRSPFPASPEAAAVGQVAAGVGLELKNTSLPEALLFEVR